MEANEKKKADKDPGRKVNLDPDTEDPTAGPVTLPPDSQQGDKGFSEGLGGAGEKELDETDDAQSEQHASQQQEKK